MLARRRIGAALIPGVVVAAVAVVGLAQAEPDASASAAPQGAFKVDTAHSSVIFKIKHLNTANFYGRFDEASGSFNLGGSGSIDVKINMSSVNSGNAKRDLHLKGPDFFSVKEFPEASFKSSAVKHVGGNRYEAEGELTLHGVTKPVKASIEFTGAGKGNRGAAIAGIEARVTVKRSDFGMSYRTDLLGDEVEIIAALEGGQ